MHARAHARTQARSNPFQCVRAPLYYSRQSFKDESRTAADQNLTSPTINSSMAGEFFLPKEAQRLREEVERHVAELGRERGKNALLQQAEKLLQSQLQ